MGFMKIIEQSKEKIINSDMTESEVMSDLMKDFPPISREDNLVVITQVVAQHLFDTDLEFNWE